MSLLERLDFDAADEIPGMFEYKEIPTIHTQLLLLLEEASQQGNLSAVKEIIRTLRYTNARPATIAQPGSAFTLAVQFHHEEIVRYLLSEGARVSPNHVRIATSMRAKGLVQLFLDYGWPINEELGWSDPPALA
jgi:hypothetical protein